MAGQSSGHFLYKLKRGGTQGLCGPGCDRKEDGEAGCVQVYAYVFNERRPGLLPGSADPSHQDPAQGSSH